MREFAPPFHTAGPIAEELRARGFVVLSPEWAVRAGGLGISALVELASSWKRHAARSVLEGRRPLPYPAPLLVQCRRRRGVSAFSTSSALSVVEVQRLHGGMEAVVRADEARRRRATRVSAPRRRPRRTLLERCRGRGSSPGSSKPTNFESTPAMASVARPRRGRIAMASTSSRSS